MQDFEDLAPMVLFSNSPLGVNSRRHFSQLTCLIHKKQTR